MSSKLPKLQLPEDPEARRQVAGASELARAGETKAAQQALREAVTSRLLTLPLQRQILAWWSAGCYDLPGLGTGAKPGADAQPASRSTAVASLGPRAEAEETITRVMREHRWSHKEAAEYIEQGGLEMEAMRTEMDHPLDAAFNKMKAQGPPQWFLDMVNKQEAEEAEAQGQASSGDLVPVLPVAAA